MKGCGGCGGEGGEESSAGSSRLWLLSAMIAWLDALDCLIWTTLYFVYNWQDCVEGSNGGGGGTKNPFYSIYTCTYTRCIGFLWPFFGCVSLPHGDIFYLNDEWQQQRQVPAARPSREWVLASRDSYLWILLQGEPDRKRKQIVFKGFYWTVLVISRFYFCFGRFVFKCP